MRLHVSGLVNVMHLIPCFFVFLVVYVSTFLIQYLSWTPVGYGTILGVQARYFIPILILIPFMIGRGYNKKLDNYDDVLLMLVILLLPGLMTFTFVRFYCLIIIFCVL